MKRIVDLVTDDVDITCSGCLKVVSLSWEKVLDYVRRQGNRIFYDCPHKNCYQNTDMTFRVRRLRELVIEQSNQALDTTYHH
jgi:hypothetical protein